MRYISYQQCFRLTFSLLLTIYLYLSLGSHLEVLFPRAHATSIGLRYTCSFLLLWSFIHLGCIVGLAMLLKACLRLPGLDHWCSRHAPHTVQTWVAHTWDATRSLHQSSGDLNDHIAVDMSAETLRGVAPASAPLDTDIYDVFEEWEDILVDAGLCARTEPAWQDAWIDSSEPVKSASPPPRNITPTCPIKLVVPTSKTQTEPLPKAKCDKLTSDVIRLQNELHAERKRCARLDESKRRCEKENRELRDLSNDLRAELAEAERREATLRSDVAHARAEVADINNQLALAHKRIEDLARERSAARADADSLHTQLQGRNVALTTCAEKMREDEELNAQLIALVTFFQKQALRLRAELDAQRPPPPPRTFHVMHLRTQPLTRPAAADGVSMSSWSPSEYVKQLKRREYAHRVHMQKLHEQAEGAVKKLRAELAIAIEQRNELKAETDRLYAEIADLKRDGASTRHEEGEEVGKMKDELLAATAQRDELMDEVVALHAQNATLIQDALHAEAEKVAAQEELARVRGVANGDTSDSTNIPTSSTALTDAAPGELTILRQSIDSAYAPLGPVMAERLAARGIILQREPRHDEKVTMLAEFALHLAAESASPPNAAPPSPSPPDAAHPSTSSVSTGGESDTTAQPQEASAVSAVKSTRSTKASGVSRLKRSTSKSLSKPAKPATDATTPATDSRTSSTSEAIQPAMQTSSDAEVVSAAPRTEPARATPPSGMQHAAAVDAPRDSQPSIRSSAAALAAYAASLTPPKQSADKPASNAPKMVAKAKALAQLRQLGGACSPVLKGPVGTSSHTSKA